MEQCPIHDDLESLWKKGQVSQLLAWSDRYYRLLNPLTEPEVDPGWEERD